VPLAWLIQPAQCSRVAHLAGGGFYAVAHGCRQFGFIGRGGEVGKGEALIGCIPNRQIGRHRTGQQSVVRYAYIQPREDPLEPDLAVGREAEQSAMGGFIVSQPSVVACGGGQKTADLIQGVLIINVGSFVGIQLHRRQRGLGLAGRQRTQIVAVLRGIARPRQSVADKAVGPLQAAYPGVKPINLQVILGRRHRVRIKHPAAGSRLTVIIRVGEIIAHGGWSGPAAFPAILEWCQPLAQINRHIRRRRRLRQSCCARTSLRNR